MKPTKNRVFCPECQRAKMLFDTEEKAERFIKFNKDEMDVCPVRAYYCVACCGWHLTRRKRYVAHNLDSNNVVESYRHCQEQLNDMRIDKIMESKKLLPIHNFLLDCVKGRKTFTPSHEQLTRLKDAYISLDKSLYKSKIVNRTNDMFVSLGVDV